MSILNSITKIYLRNRKRRNAARKRSILERQSANTPNPPAGIARRAVCEKVEISGANAWWLNKGNQSAGVVVYLHGGSYVTGPYREQWGYFANLCKRTGFAGLLVDYKLAPQFPFPHGLNDVIGIISTLAGQGELPENWCLAGDSAGAGLAVATVFKLKELGQPFPRKLILMSGYFDVTLENPAIKLNAATDVMLTYGGSTIAEDSYVGKEDPRNPLISPLFGDLSVLPPTLIQIGTADMLLWDCRKFYLKCLDLNVGVEYEEYPDAFHDFMMAGFLPEAKRALKSQTEFLLR